MEEPTTFTGSCYCRSVQFTVNLAQKPVHTAYCHCHSCTRAHAAALYWVCYVDAECFSITEGGEFVKDAKRPAGSAGDNAAWARQFCTECGSRVCNVRIPTTMFKDGSQYEGRMTTGFFPALIENREQLPPSCIPSEHGCALESCLPLCGVDPSATKEANRAALGKQLPVISANSCDYVPEPSD